VQQNLEENTQTRDCLLYKQDEFLMKNEKLRKGKIFIRPLWANQKYITK
jgi:hypothetical protein